jgi:hypothetical protein
MDPGHVDPDDDRPEVVTNRFTCPLPAGADKCKCVTDDTKVIYPGVTCINAPISVDLP